MGQVRQLDDWRYSKDGLHHGAGDFIPAACRLEEVSAIHSSVPLMVKSDAFRTSCFDSAPH